MKEARPWKGSGRVVPGPAASQCVPAAQALTLGTNPRTRKQVLGRKRLHQALAPRDAGLHGEGDRSSSRRKGDQLQQCQRHRGTNTDASQRTMQYSDHRSTKSAREGDTGRCDWRGGNVSYDDENDASQRAVISFCVGRWDVVQEPDLRPRVRCACAVVGKHCPCPRPPARSAPRACCAVPAARCAPVCPCAVARSPWCALAWRRLRRTIRRPSSASPGLPTWCLPGRGASWTGAWRLGRTAARRRCGVTRAEPG